MNSQSEKKQQSSSSWRRGISNVLVPAAAAGCLLVVLGGFVQLHASKHFGVPDLLSRPPTDGIGRSSSGRSLERERTFYDTINDDITHDDTCKEYMSKFLDGTTDFKDECQGMYNAYKAANCVDEHSNLHHRILQTNTTSSGDDDNNDDFFDRGCCTSIFDYYTKHCHEPRLDSPRLLGIVFVLALCGFMKGLTKSLGLDWIPDAASCIMVGALTGASLRVVDPELVRESLSFNGDMFLHILLPPIIFQASLHIDKRCFQRDLFAILNFAIFGTFFSAVAVGYMTHALTGIPFLDSLMFGALISSIDPVATLGVLSGVGVSQTDTLYTLIFGESLLNDGVAIVLFDTLLEHLGDNGVVDHATVGTIFVRFVLISFGSILVGVLCGCVCTLYFWALWGKHSAVMEVSIFFTWSLIPFYLSDAIGCSGIISIMVMGFMLDYYVIGGFQSEEAEWMGYMQLRAMDEDGTSESTVPTNTWMQIIKEIVSKAFSGRGHILSRSRHHVGFVAEVIAIIMETAIFAYLGLFLFNDNNTWDFQFNSVAIFSCVTSRAMMVILFSLFINLCVLCDMETLLVRFCFSRRWCSGGGDGDGGGPQEDYQTATADEDDTITSETKKFLDFKTQLVLILAGVRGAVSFALAANIPVYDVVTKQGSQYKAELKAMTSSSIFLTIFVMGALTYFCVGGGTSGRQGDRERMMVGPLTNRLLTNIPLGSDAGDSISSGDFMANPTPEFGMMGGTTGGSPSGGAPALEIENNPIQRGRFLSGDQQQQQQQTQ